MQNCDSTVLGLDTILSTPGAAGMGLGIRAAYRRAERDISTLGLQLVVEKSRGACIIKTLML